MKVLIMGNCLFDVELAFWERYQELLSEEALKPEVQQRKRHTDYPHDEQVKVFNSKDFFLGIPSRPKAMEAVKEMMKLGHSVKMCIDTIRPDDSPEGYLQQGQVIQRELKKHFGAEFARHFSRNQVIMTRDRTELKADILISEDEQTGDSPPEWEMIVFDTPYNQNLTGYRRLTWNNWREVVGI